MTPALELVAVDKDYGRVRAVRGLSLQVPDGALFGLIGPNGAGKTTTFGLLSGFLHPTRGEVRVRGVPLTPGRPPVGRVLALPQDAALPDRMRALEVLVMLARLAGASKIEAIRRARRALEQVHLEALADRPISAMSHGQRRRVGIAQTLLGDDEVILLDEPTAGLDARSAADLRALVRELHAQRTIVLSSHNLQEVEALCDHAAILDRGTLAAAGTMAEIKSTSSLVHILLAKPAAAAEGLLERVQVLPGVRSARWADGAARLELQLADGVGEGETDAAVNGALKVLLEGGASVRQVDRGKSLEQRFLEETGGPMAAS